MAGPTTLDLDGVWQDALRDVLRAVTGPMERRWLASTLPVGFSDDTLVLAAPHTFARDWLHRNCAPLLAASIEERAGRPITLVVTVSTQAVGPADPATVAEALSTPAMVVPPVIDERAVPGSVDRSTAPLVAEATRGALEERDALSGLDSRLRGPLELIEEDPFAPPMEQPLEAPGRPAGPSVALPDVEPRTDDIEPDTRLNPRYTFDSFVIGSSNRFAHAAATAVSESPAKSYNPLFIYGGAGLGKTHLLHAIGHYVRHLYPRLRVRYVTSEQFTNEFINAVMGGSDRIGAFQRTYRMVDVLLIDDIQFLQDKERTQEEFFHTFNALHNAEKQIVISSDRKPKQIAQLEERLRSRFEWGLQTDIQPPDLETRIAILRRKAEIDALPLSHDVLEVIASKAESNIRELEGALIRVSAFASLQRAPADPAMAEFVLKDLFPIGREREVSVQDIMDEVAAYFSVSVEDLCSPSRSRQLVNARQIAMYLTRELTDLSLPRIGKAFGNRDHSTVMHANQKIANLMQEQRSVYDQVQELTNRVTARTRSTR
ncbi:MAG: hypothetical protein RLZZ272_498 [Actinomycetota bacterium]